MATVHVYATPSQLADWTGQTPPTDAVAYLRTAAIVVARATVTAVYDVDTSGIATGTAVLTALREATCAHAAAMIAAGLPADGSGAGAGPVVATSMGPASVTYASDGQTAAASRTLYTTVAPTAYTILQVADLVGGEAWQW